MRFSEIDWSSVVTRLPAWDGLPFEVRRSLLDAFRPWAGLKGVTLPTETVEALRDSDFLELDDDHRPQVTPPSFPVVALAWSLRPPLFATRRERDLVAYTEAHLSEEERQALLTTWGPPFDRPPLVDVIRSRRWVEGFLSGGGSAWEGVRAPGGRPACFVEPGTAEGTREVIELLLEAETPLTLQEVSRELEVFEPTLLAASLRGGLRYLLFFGDLDAQLRPVIGLWPAVAERLGREVPELTPADPAHTFRAPFAADDLASLLQACGERPPHIRASDYALDGRSGRRLHRYLYPLPGWIVEALGLTPEKRVQLVVDTLTRHRFVTARGEHRHGLRLEPSGRGKSWLALEPEERLESLLAALKRSRRRGPEPSRSWEREGPDFLPRRIDPTLLADGFDLAGAVAAAFHSLPPGLHYPVALFLGERARGGNPLWQSARAGPHLGWVCQEANDAVVESLWSEQLFAFLTERLLAYGSAELGRTDSGELTFALARSSRFLLSRPEGSRLPTTASP